MAQDSIEQPPTTPILTVTEGRALVQLNRPRQHNRIEPDDLTRLREICDEVDADPSVRVLVLTATGKSFSSGFHIGALAGKTDYDPTAFERTVDRIEALRVPSIVALNGGIYGGSIDLGLACDFRIGVPETRMFMPAARLGIVYYKSGLSRYVSRLGLGAAKRLFLTAQPLGAEELLRIGYLDEIVPPEDLMTRANALAETIAGNAPLSVAATKRAFNQIAANALDVEALEAARAACGKSEDHQEGLRAWAEKRHPQFKGR
jgi:enoyl-CoA hydratase/carnithine racemase